MAVSANLKDLGWMYHSPAVKRNSAQVMAPPTSQIPGLGNMPDSMAQKENEPRKGVIKDTDTPYIIMAKQGGRRDLLCFKENNISSSSAKGYPRCDWFYLEDNFVEDQTQEKDQWQFRLPEYMVHQAYNPSVDKRGPHSRLPYATDMDLRNNGLSENATQLPELRKPGYGVRLAKAKAKETNGVVRHNVIKVPEPFRRLPENEAARPKNYDIFDDPNRKETNASMGKLLAMGYGKDWVEARDTYDISRIEYERRQRERIQQLSEQTVNMSNFLESKHPNSFYQQQQQQQHHQQKQQKQQEQFGANNHNQQQQNKLPPWRPGGKPEKQTID